MLTCGLPVVTMYDVQVEYGSSAILKHNLCTGKRHYWRRPSHALTEPFFIPHPTYITEDSGVVIFAARDGVGQASYLVVLDAQNLETLSMERIRSQLTFSTHGEWFGGLVSNGGHKGEEMSNGGP